MLSFNRGGPIFAILTALAGIEPAHKGITDLMQWQTNIARFSTSAKELSLLVRYGSAVAIRPRIPGRSAFG